MERKQEAAIAALLTAPTIAAAAQAVGISEGTLWRWLQLPEFQEKYREAKRQAVAQAIARLQQATTKAVDTLESIMTDDEAPPSSKVTAAKTVLEMAIKGIELEDLAARIETLEKSLEKRGSA
ncbi:MAG: phage protein [Peptococcaceae bacterium BRH_c4b]|nr:MAG: phage protein [Peptococcaceae bacterium BRH_c4b]